MNRRPPKPGAERYSSGARIACRAFHTAPRRWVQLRSVEIGLRTEEAQHIVVLRKKTLFPQRFVIKAKAAAFGCKERRFLSPPLALGITINPLGDLKTLNSKKA